jgi:AcrR family transcriptional regulator
MGKGQQTQDRIIEAAYKLFVDQGYHGTSMRQIAKRADLTPASIYNHFESKEQIFVEIVRKYHPYHEMLPILETAQGDDVETLIRNVSTQIYEIMRARKDLLNILFIEMVEFDGIHFQDIFSQFSPQIFAFIDRLKHTKGSLRAASEGSILLSVMGLVLSHWLLDAIFINNIQLPKATNHFQDALDIYLHGLLAGPEEA